MFSKNDKSSLLITYIKTRFFFSEKILLMVILGHCRINMTLSGLSHSYLKNSFNT
jgi:hypothetical protein